MADELKLLGFWPSTFVQRIELALQLKGLHYQYEEEDLYNNKSQLLFHSNPVYRKVPVLIHNGRPICESLIILEYIEETWPNHGVALLPSHPYQRAQARFLADVIQKKIFGQRIEKSIGPEQLQEIHYGYSVLNAALQGKHYFGGEEIGFVDVAFAPFVPALYALASIYQPKLLPEEEKCPHLVSWMEVVMDHPVVKKALPHRQKMLDFLIKTLP